MNNGCLCCSVRDTGLLAILALMEKKGRFDQIVLETTGLADPGPIIQAFWNEPALQIGAFLSFSLLPSPKALFLIFYPPQTSR
jgi:G3E family GTPase